MFLSRFFDNNLVFLLKILFLELLFETINVLFSDFFVFRSVFVVWFVSFVFENILSSMFCLCLFKKKSCFWERGWCVSLFVVICKL